MQEIKRQEDNANTKFKQVCEEGRLTQDENRVLNDEIKSKDDIIKTLTKENLQINAKVT